MVEAGAFEDLRSQPRVTVRMDQASRDILEPRRRRLSTTLT